jgi:hypothetical protein
MGPPFRYHWMLEYALVTSAFKLAAKPLEALLEIVTSPLEVRMFPSSFTQTEMATGTVGCHRA